MLGKGAIDDKVVAGVGRRRILMCVLLEESIKAARSVRSGVSRLRSLGANG